MLSGSVTSKQSLTVWLLTDEKPGHRNQLLGLGERLQAVAGAQVELRSLQQMPISISDWLLKRAPDTGEQTCPDWVVGAGHRTHRSVLFSRRLFNAKSIVLMKPTLPLGWFDACIIPHHDNPPQRESVLATHGVLNTMTPRPHGRKADQGVILIGGESAHFTWHSERVVQQVTDICMAQPSLRWTLSTSRRTPDDFFPLLQQRNLLNLTLMAADQTPPGWVREQLESAVQVWVTRDSVSMVFESITAAAPTGLLALPAAKSSRVVNSMKDVIKQGWAMDFEHWNTRLPLPDNKQTLWESDRAARWLLQRFGVSL
ncbi:MAG: hypothetical protein D6160_06325 [Ketobacter sp.]|nr:MAG: hypothetical protein D6160_06325 [Ketobacter sp.]